MSARGMATNMVHVAMAATAINALALRNVGLADGNVASLICFQHRYADRPPGWEVGKLMRGNRVQVVQACAFRLSGYKRCCV